MVAATDIGNGKEGVGEAAGSSFDVAAETERLLSLRIRDIRLEGPMLELYRRQSFRQRQKIVRAWMLWVSVFSIGVAFINGILLPGNFWEGVVICCGIIPTLNLLVSLSWAKPRSARAEGMTILAWTIATIFFAGLLGAHGTGFEQERYLTGTTFIAAMGILVLGLEVFWTAALAVATMTVFLSMMLLNPETPWWVALAVCSYYGPGLLAAVVARRTVLLLAQHAFLMGLRDKHRSEALAEANRRLEALASIDPLTGIFNRRAAVEHVERIWQSGSAKLGGVAMIMADIDHFKRLNDSRGHAVGDDCIRAVAATIAASLRSGSDIVSRHGGEEFLVVLTDATPDIAQSIAERIRGAVEGLAIANPGAEGGIVTLSLGIAMAKHGEGPERVAKRADEALYEAKRRGRNRVWTAATAPASPSLLGAPPMAASGKAKVVPASPSVS